MVEKDAEMFDLSPEPFVPHSCSYCQKIVVADEPRRQPFLRCQLYQAGKSGCIVLAYLSNYWDEFMEDDEKGHVLRVRRTLSLSRSDWGIDNFRGAVVDLAHFKLQTTYTRIDCDPNSRDHRLIFDVGGQSIYPSYRITAESKNYAGSKFTTRPINRIVSSKAALAQAREWLETCAYHGPDKHRQCPVLVAGGSKRFCPSRLVQIDTKQGLLSLTSEKTLAREPLQYACLSYCWGGSQPFTTTKETLRQRMQGFKISELPRTLQDAVTVTRKLDIRFIWIDCLCIVQDDTVDMTREIANMPQIYMGAYVTITASSASTCYDGFLATRYLDRRVQYSNVDDFVLPYQHNGITSPIYLYPGGRRYENELLSEYDPINERAWTFQERELSPRVLIFGSHQLEWICSSHVFRDGGFKDIEHERLLVKYAALGPADMQYGFISDWMETIEGYSWRTLSYPEDKLVAISAIASRLGALVKMAYIAGLWDHDLGSQLLWRAQKPTARVKKYRAPSWSWASVDGSVDYLVLNLTSVLRIVSTAVVPTDPDFEYGAVRHASLTVEGPLLESLWLPNRKRIVRSGLSHRDRVSWTTYSDAIEPDWDTEDLDFGVEVCCLICRINNVSRDYLGDSGRFFAMGLFLVADSSSEDTYRRVGLFHVNGTGEDQFKTIEKRMVTLI